MANSNTDRRRRRPVIFGLIFGGLSALAVAAFAAVITLTTTSSIGAGSVAVTACDSTYQVDLGAPTWDASAGDFVVTTVTFSGIDPTACASELVRVELVNSSSVSLAAGAAAVGGTGSGTITLNAPVGVSSVDRIVSALYAP